jgi:hypothetical protein
MELKLREVFKLSRRIFQDGVTISVKVTNIGFAKDMEKDFLKMAMYLLEITSWTK